MAGVLDGFGRVALSLATTAARATGSVMEHQWQTRQWQHIAVRRRKVGPLCKARLGLADIERGRQRGEDGLVAIGEATIMSAVVAADLDDAVPDYITARVLRLGRGIDPLTSPLVSAEVARKVIRIRQAVTRDLSHDRRACSAELTPSPREVHAAIPDAACSCA